MTNCHSFYTPEWLCKEAHVSIRKFLQNLVAVGPFYFEKVPKGAGKGAESYN